ncbi:SoxR reducing system RseC family protein [Sinimarinibacterium sp. CAU 1509]|uniref:SoxR reducing system RseC family protein n=1 Tax=Sinimarinibacterium sp. CAU 1509 TaxID=2562283 RepID=UPI00146B6471|nr:SoxR reducing system RseC family protein [Sinimarinibacterium sp. CAU 1509]
MIEERAIVSRIERDQGQERVWVRAFGPESCPKCAEGRGCGGGVLAKLVSRRRPEVQVGGTLPQLQAGETVIVGIDDGAIMRASLWVYLVPLLGMFGFGAFAQQVLHTHDVLVAGFGLTGLVAGFLLTSIASQRAGVSGNYRPSLLRREIGAERVCARLPEF